MESNTRKEDGSANLLLFIYKFHKRFVGPEYDRIKLSKLLEIMDIFGKNESSSRMALSRSVKAGILINSRGGNEVFYSLGPTGRKIIDEYVLNSNCVYKRYAGRKNEWDGKWMLVSLLGQGQNYDCKELANLGFVKVLQETWATSHNLIHELDNFNEKHIVMHAGITDEDLFKDHILKRFDANTQKKLYEGFIEIYKDKMFEMQDKLAKNLSVELEYAVRLFYETGSSYFSIAMKDPFLPLDILPEWPGDEAAQIAFGIFSGLTPLMNEYFCGQKDKKEA